jgi:hypothetical protein
MSGLRRAPREVYRLYGEREYLAGAGCELGPARPERSGGESQRMRITSVAMLLAALGTLGGVVVLNWPGQLRRTPAHRVGARWRTAPAPLIAMASRPLRARRSSDLSPRPHLGHASRAARRVGARLLERVNGETSTPVAVAFTPPVPAPSSGAGSSRHPEQPEFGFER